MANQGFLAGAPVLMPFFEFHLHMVNSINMDWFLAFLRPLYRFRLFESTSIGKSVVLALGCAKLPFVSLGFHSHSWRA